MPTNQPESPQPLWNQTLLCSGSLTASRLSFSWILCCWFVQPWFRLSKAKLLNSVAPEFPSWKKGFSSGWLHSLGPFDNIRGGIRSVSYASMKGISPIRMTSQRLGGSQGTRGKGCELFPVQWRAFLRVADDEGKKQTESRCPASETLAPSLSESGWALCFEMEFLFSFFWAVGWLHTQPVKAMAVNNRICFWDHGSKQSLESHPMVMYSPKVSFFFYFMEFWELGISFPFIFSCTTEVDSVAGKQKRLFQGSLSKMQRVKGEFASQMNSESHVPNWDRGYKDPVWPVNASNTQ